MRWMKELIKNRGVMKTDFILSQKYADLGFEMSRFGKESIALRRENKIIFVFSSTIDVSDDFVSRLCDCHVKLTNGEKSKEPSLA
ncbi:MAG: hypothetical protein H6Q39_1895 [Chloroflexi bacterium]|nr:hypothetical protein [Chloroflexota bacterium]